MPETYIESGEIIFNKIMQLEVIEYPYNLKGKTLYFSDIDFNECFLFKLEKENSTRVWFQSLSHEPIKNKVCRASFIDKIIKNIKEYKFVESNLFLVDSATGQLIWDVTRSKPIDFFFKRPPKITFPWVFCYYTNSLGVNIPTKLAGNSKYNLPAVAFVQNKSGNLLKPKINHILQYKTTETVFEILCLEVGISPKIPSYTEFKDYIIPKREKTIIPDECLGNLQRIMEEKWNLIFDTTKEKEKTVTITPSPQIPLTLPPTTTLFKHNPAITQFKPKKEERISLEKIAQTGLINEDGELDIDLDLTGYGINEGHINKGWITLFTTDKEFYSQTISNLDVVKSILNLDNITVIIK